MGTLIASTLLAAAAKTLRDPDGIRWTLAEKLGYLSAGQREAVMLNPVCHTVDAVIPLVPGVRQSLPANALALVTVNANMGADGATPGAAITSVHRPDFDQALPTWRADPTDPVVLHYLYDDRHPRSFEIYPPQPNPAGQVEATFATTPADLVDANAAIALPDAYESALYHYVLYRAYAREGGNANPAKAQSYYVLFRQLVTGRYEIRNAQHPTQAARRAQE